MAPSPLRPQIIHPSPTAIDRCLRYIPRLYMPLPPTPFPMPSNSRLNNPIHLGQGTTLSSPTRGPQKPLELTILPPSPPPAGHPLPPVQAPHSSPTRDWSPKTLYLRTRQRRKWEEVRGCTQGPQNVSYAIKTAAESWSHLDRHAVL